MGAAALLLLPYWLVKGLRQRKYLFNLRERLGLSTVSLDKLPAGGPGAIWIHAVSVGELLSSIALAKRLKETYPNRPLVVSTTTITAQSLARERLEFADAVFYFPLDWSFCVRRVLRAVRPSLIVVLETEIWPNFLRETRRQNIPVLFASGRISDRSFARYQRYLAKFGFFLRPFLRTALGNASAFLMQSEKDAERIRALGAPAERVSVSGNLKYDMELPAATPLSSWLEAEARRQGRSPIVVAGSVVATEEPLALIAFGVVQGEHPNALLVLAPRKPERFEAAAEFILESLYRLADGAFVGGSLVPSGGHNILEPAAFGKIPVFGPSMENFAEIASRFVAAGAAIQVESPEDAGVAWIELLRDPERRHKMGENAKHLVDSSRGATDRALAEISKFLGSPAQ